MEMALVIAAVLAFIAFKHWLRHQTRVMIHRERLAAIEKGLDLPQLPGEPAAGRINVRRILLLSGLIWMALGIGAFAVLYALSGSPMPDGVVLPRGMAMSGIVPLLLGVAFLIAWAAERKC